MKQILPMNYYKTSYASPVGNLMVTSDGEVITGILFTDTDHENSEQMADLGTLPEVMQHGMHQLDEYFAGSRRTFDVPVAQPGTLFQQSVWKALEEIPYGDTWSYLALARHIGNEKSIRAVGTTNGKSQISIIVPCHRVIGSDGSLIGYGGGLWRKKWLLEHEQRIRFGIQTLF